MASRKRTSFDDSAVGAKPDAPIKLQRTNSFDKIAPQRPSAKGSADDVLARPLPTVSASAGTGEEETKADVETGGTAVVTAKKTKHYAGLANQGATCYMNSLLQTLFMTPEFRRILYMWQYDPSKDDEEADCIPLQLQILFGQLQLTDMRAATTTALTHSFGWTSRDAFQQHDVQELARVLFDALERSLSKTPNAQLMQQLFKGTLNDYVKCQKCGKERSRVDNFLDLSLVIKPFGSDIAMGSVEEALADYVKQESMDGDNKVHCEMCDEKTTSIKGLKIADPPYVLQLQLKRFVFDFTTMDRQKLNDKVTFPLYLDMNPFVGDGSAVKDGIMASTEKVDGAAVEADGADEDKAPIAAVADAADPLQLLRIKGPHVYELYAVLVHSGGARAGHYYAYIKDMDTQLWHCFNDSSVTAVDVKEVLACCGGEVKSTYGSYTYVNSANAYMLMYRKVVTASSDCVDSISTDSNLVLPRALPTEDEVPSFVRQKIEEQSEKAKLEDLVAEQARQTLNLRVYYGKDNRYVKVLRSSTIAEATRNALEAFELQGSDAESQPTVLDSGQHSAVLLRSTDRVVQANCARLRKYAAHTETSKEPLEFLAANLKTATGEPSAQTLEAVGVNAYTDLILETRDSAEDEWESYDPDAIQVNYALFDNAADNFKAPVRIYVNKNAALADLAVKLSTATGIPRDRMRIMKFNTYGTNPECKEYLTHAALGLKPLIPADIAGMSPAEKSRLPVDNYMRVVGDTMTLGSDLSLRYYDNIKLFIEELPESTVLPEFDPFDTDTKSNGESAPTSTPYAGTLSASKVTTGAFRDFSLTDRGMRVITSTQSRAVAAFERELNSVVWKLNRPPSTVANEELLLDQRLTARQLYEAVSKYLGIPVGEFIIRREVSTGRLFKLADIPGCLREASWVSNKGGTLFICSGPTPTTDQFLGQVVLRVPEPDVIPGTDWIKREDPLAELSHNRPIIDGAGAGAIPGGNQSAPGLLSDWFPQPLSEEEARELSEKVAANIDPGEAPQRLATMMYTCEGVPGSFQAVAPVLFNTTTALSTIREVACNRLLARGILKDGLTVRMRSKTGARLGNELNPAGVVGDVYQYPYDGLEFAVDVIPEPAGASPDPSVLLGISRHQRKIINLCWWDRARSRIGLRREIAVLSTDTMQSIARRVAMLPGVAEVAQQCVDIGKRFFRPPPPPPKPTNQVDADTGAARVDHPDPKTSAAVTQPSSAVAEDAKARLLRALMYVKLEPGRDIPVAGKLSSFQWKHLHSDDRLLSSYSLGIDDGSTIILADFDVLLRPLTSAEKERVGLAASPTGSEREEDPLAYWRQPSTAYKPSYPSYSYAPIAPRKEAGIKILTKAERDAQKAKDDAPSMGQTSPEVADFASVTTSHTAASDAAASPATATTHSAVRDYLPGGPGGKRQSTTSFSNPLYRGKPKVEDEARKAQEEAEMDAALGPDPAIVALKQSIAETGISEEAIGGVGMSLFDDILG